MLKDLVKDVLKDVLQDLKEFNLEEFKDNMESKLFEGKCEFIGDKLEEIE